jgi:hypothetical protein
MPWYWTCITYWNSLIKTENTEITWYWTWNLYKIVDIHFRTCPVEFVSLLQRTWCVFSFISLQVQNLMCIQVHTFWENLYAAMSKPVIENLYAATSWEIQTWSKVSVFVFLVSVLYNFLFYQELCFNCVNTTNDVSKKWMMITISAIANNRKKNCSKHHIIALHFHKAIKWKEYVSAGTRCTNHLEKWFRTCTSKSHQDKWSSVYNLTYTLMPQDKPV